MKINGDKIPQECLLNIKEYYSQLWIKSKGISNHFVENLPSTLKSDVLMERFKDCFYNNPIFLLTEDNKEILNTPLIRSILRFTDIRIYLKNE
jgi:hypothetical protein